MIATKTDRDENTFELIEVSCLVSLPVIVVPEECGLRGKWGGADELSGLSGMFNGISVFGEDLYFHSQCSGLTFASINREVRRTADNWSNISGCSYGQSPDDFCTLTGSRDICAACNTTELDLAKGFIDPKVL